MSTLENLKELANLAQKLGNIDLYRKIVELEGEVIELTREKRVLEEENANLRSKIKRATTMKFKEPFWYADGDSVPHCPNCWEANERAIHLTYKGHMAGGHRYDCPQCKSVFCSERIPAPSSRG